MIKRKIFIPRKSVPTNTQEQLSDVNKTVNVEEQFLYDDNKDNVSIENIFRDVERDAETNYYIVPEKESERINLDSPFLEEIQDEKGYTEDKSSDEIEIPVDELERDRHDLEVEKLRRKINVLNLLVSKNKDAKAFALCLDSVFELEIQFELAWNLVVSKMEYSALTGNSAVSLDKNKLKATYKELEKIRRITVLIELVRVLGFPSLEEKLTNIMMAKEFKVPTANELSERETMIFNKLEKMLTDYASRIKDSKI